MLGLNPYAILGAAAIWLASLTGVYFYATAHESRKWEAATARLQVEAAATLAAAENRTREAENKASEAALKADGDYVAAQEEINRNRADFDRRLAERVRDAKRRACGGSVVPPAAPGASDHQDAAAGSNDGLGGVDLERVRAIRDAGLKLQAIVKTCHDWAGQVGR